MIWRFTPARSTCAPIIRMRAAPRARAATMRAATSGRPGCVYGAAISSSPSQWAKSKSLTRSASGFTCRRKRSKIGYLLAIGKKRGEQFVAAQKVGDDEVRAHAREPLPLPFAHPAALGLGRGHAHRHAAHLLDILDLHVAIAEAQQFRACAFRRGDQALDQDLLREAPVVVQRAVDAAFEVARNVQQPGLFAHVRLSRGAG